PKKGIWFNALPFRNKSRAEAFYAFVSIPQPSPQIFLCGDFYSPILMKSALLKFSPFLGLALCLGCQPDPNYKPQPTPEDATVVIQIHHEVDGEALVREKTWYTNAN